MKGCGNMLLPCIMVGMCKSITIILDGANIMDTIIHFLASLLNSFPPALTAFGMFMVQDIFNILVPSGSGQAAVMIPLMTPIADLVGITRQVAVQAFQFGDGLCNLLTPLNGPMMGCLAMVGISFPKYIKWAFKYLMMNIGAAIAITMILQAIGWTGL